MFEDRPDLIARIVSHLRQPAHFDAALDQHVMQQIATLPRPGGWRRAPAVWHWLTRPRALAVSPLGALALAAGLGVIALVVPWRRTSAPPTDEGARQLPFVVIAPHAARVSLIGDFNDWDAARTPMRRLGEGSAVWTTVVPLAPGRYRYAFLADGSRWLADPAAPLARDDEFGPPSSVVTVGGS